MQRVRPVLRYYLYGVYTVAALLASVLLILPTRASTDLLTILLTCPICEIHSNGENRAGSCWVA